MSPRLLDLFCGAGGAARGYQRAGFYVVGVDVKPQPRYAGDEFVQADAMTYPLDGFDAIHASSPCQRFSMAQRLQGNEHPDLLTPIRDRMIATGLPFVIENVVGARALMRDPTMLCGAAFPELNVYRHRLFESNVSLPLVLHPGHGVKLTKLGHAPVDGEFMHVVGHFNGVVRGAKAMGIDWPMTQGELAEAIPPAFTEWIGTQLLAALENAA